MWNILKEKSAGKIRIESSKTKLYHSFLDYIRGGLNFSVVTCIDFTGSNGEPNSPSSLHYQSPTSPNQYQQAIGSVCSVLMNYDYDKQIQVFGFGATPNFPNAQGEPFNQVTSHFFPCSGDMNNTSGNGVEGVFQLYNNALKNLELSGPTYFSHLLERAINFTGMNMKNNPDNYTILLILTDGVIHDMSETIGWLIEASKLPMSVVIVGVGDEDFSQMQILDGDSSNLKTKGGAEVVRDIVQFVPFKRFSGANKGRELAMRVLKELPNQVTGYYEMIGRPPNPEIKPDFHKVKF